MKTLCCLAENEHENYGGRGRICREDLHIGHVCRWQISGTIRAHSVSTYIHTFKFAKKKTISIASSMCMNHNKVAPALVTIWIHRFENLAKDIKLGDQTYPVTLWDTAGQEDYERLRPLSYPNVRSTNNLNS